MRKGPFWGFLVVFVLMLAGSLAINFLTDHTLYLAPLIGLAGSVWALLRLRGVTHLAGLRIGRNEGLERDRD
ncbi:hypothetical protein Y5W_02306 [Alcanivorax sp. 521-1]|uniref:Uncharacterized protein n=1 Tax=Alloalcanivorax profundimaris TaxID=2735259 RepID=A0ABS0AS94_9GAMM|nr:hypothetical protein [Alloalcanivorax profundimaris]MBF5057012.1 hypothetical protein [Alloalcanivorax profundimaris]MBG14700.1 hypothetical protein [Alcanivorax sp.]